MKESIVEIDDTFIAFRENGKWVPAILKDKRREQECPPVQVFEHYRPRSGKPKTLVACHTVEMARVFCERRRRMGINGAWLKSYPGEMRQLPSTYYAQLRLARQERMERGNGVYW